MHRERSTRSQENEVSRARRRFRGGEEKEKDSTAFSRTRTMDIKHECGPLHPSPSERPPQEHKLLLTVYYAMVDKLTVQATDHNTLDRLARPAPFPCAPTDPMARAHPKTEPLRHAGTQGARGHKRLSINPGAGPFVPHRHYHHITGGLTDEAQNKTLQPIRAHHEAALQEHRAPGSRTILHEAGTYRPWNRHPPRSEPRKHAASRSEKRLSPAANHMREPPPASLARPRLSPPP